MKAISLNNSSRGFAGLYLFLSIFGVLLGLFLVWHGITGNSLGSLAVLTVGIFMTIKEILDMIH